ncbi:MAG: ABC transporter ATP-binding protein [Clostridiales bacterium]|nr:ABC transporter ATP-binding protein [Clostridiales bacterium]
MSENLLSVDDLIVSFEMYSRGRSKSNLEVIHSLSLDVNKGEIVAVVGASGSGKSILASAILGLLPSNANVGGNISYKGQEIDEKSIRKFLGREIAYIPQSVDYLDPLMKVGKQVVGVYGSKEKQEKLFKRYNLSPETENKYPFELSGGMARRILISSAVMGDADLIIADEPTPGLDFKMAMETLKHFRHLADQGTGILLITHDIELGIEVADRIAVFYAGSVLELAPVEDFVHNKDSLRHPYSRAFIDALPQNEFKSIKGVQPYAGNLPKGCVFGPRCYMKDDKCLSSIPMTECRGGKVRCVHASNS